MNEPSAAVARVLQAEQERIEAIERAVPTAVSVFVPGGGGGGSGVLISPDGYALTNFHVSSPAGVHMRCGLADGKVYDAVIIGIDPVGDLAMIRLLGRDDFPAAKLGDSQRVQAGDSCFVVGNPFLLATNLQPTVTWGMISGVGRYQYPSGTLLEYANCLQTDASINPGNSGGPIYNAEGELIGIVGRCSFEKRGRVNVGVGYAISINQAKHFLGYLHSGRILDHATLGATVATDPDGAVRVSNILESSDAYRRGLRYGDEVLELAGRVVTTANDFKNILGTLPKEWRVPLVFRHEGETIETLVRLSGVHLPDELLEKMASAVPPPPPRPEAPQPAPADDPDQPADREAGKERDAEGTADEQAPADEDAPAEEQASPYPPAVADRYTARQGYANYFPNVQKQQELVKALRRHTPQAPSREANVDWIIRGETVEETPRQLELTLGESQQRLQVRLGEETESLELARASERFEAIESQSLVALLTAFDAYRRMRQLGPKAYGDTYYLGTMPLLGELPLRDVLVGTAGDIETRFLLHPQSARLEAIECFATRDTDPAELIFRWPDAAPGDASATPLPLTVALRFGTEPLVTFRVSSWDVQATPAVQ